MTILSSLSTPEQAHAILNVVEQKWSDLIGYMPMKICFPALKNRDWEIITGCDPKNRPWSYHNGGNWPVLLWVLVAASLKMNRPEIGEKAVKIAAEKLPLDHWAEYYDGKNGRLIGKEAQQYQTWSVGGLLLAQALLDNPQYLDWINYPESWQHSS